MMAKIKQEVITALSENNWIIIASALILFYSIIMGYVFEPYLHELLNPVVADLTYKVETGIIQLTFHDLFLNNIMIVFRMFIYGIFFCFSVIILAFNGFFTGYYVAVRGNLIHSIVFIVPHGIFEFSSCILACSSGMVLFRFVYRFIRHITDRRESSLVNRIRDAVYNDFVFLKQALIILAVASILMAIAGVIEAYVTLPLGNYLLSLG